jgi:predicted dehydrogenase
MRKRSGSSVSRREFNRGLAAATAGAVLGFPAILRGQNLNSKVGIAMIACGGRGGSNLQSVQSENVVALCDVNAKAVEAAAINRPKAAKFSDFRKLFDKPNDFDAVVVSTCEHTHTAAILLALQHGKHVYCEKPLTHDVYEARKVREAAARAGPKVATQMGIQNHANPNYRRVVEIIQAGVIGPVREAHVWVSRAWGLQSKEAAERNKDIVYVTDRPKEAMPPPPFLDWDLWLGPAPERPFHEVYFPGPKWYRWWDFGNGTMSDLGSHWVDLPFWALKLKAPLTIAGRSEVPPHPEIAPASMTAVYEYGPREDMPAVKVTWHQGEHKPEIWKQGKLPEPPPPQDDRQRARRRNQQRPQEPAPKPLGPDNGILFIGEKGMLLSAYGSHVLLPEADFKDVKLPDPWLPRPASHHAEWLECIRNGTQPSANFEYSGWLTEANHLGNVAYRVGKKLEWDPQTLKATNAPDADQYIRRPYRKGWETLVG